MINPEEPEPRAPFPGPHAKRQPAPYKFTPDELRVLKDCNYEAFYQRCLPLSALFATAAYYGCKTGYFRANARYGPAPKVLVGVAIGYFMGKMSYQRKCAERLMQLPHSQLGEILRQRKRGNVQEGFDSGIGPSMALAPFGGMESTTVYNDINPNNSLDIDTTRPDAPGLEDYQRPSMDNPLVYEEEMPPAQKNFTSYEELRRKNREEYAQKRLGNYKEPPREPGKVSPPVYEAPPVRSGNEQDANKYGDVWG
ncbi:unnamed protein product [Acanthoscelides obtectus]|uniref:OCIA domain-containing protein n=1 Tax=Acanthoscelides obtectus TaxID=200917 RepID=A0A9P0JYU0_ACAOB|nr:unnamed protein product [Acanthoscelides obtectus]CAK1653072.1 OCIA domain-containing protein 1 [Acanthoscelides obtectus]